MPFDHDTLRKTTFGHVPAFRSTETGLGLTETDPLKDPLHDPLTDHRLSTGAKVKKALGLGEKDRIDKAKEVMAAMTTAQAVNHHRELFRDYLVRDRSSESLEFIDAVDRGMDVDQIKRTFIVENSEREVNFSIRERKRVLEEGQPPSSLREAAVRLLQSPMPRFREDPASIAKIAGKL